MSDQLSITERLSAAQDKPSVFTRAVVYDAVADAKALIRNIHQAVDGKEWNADTCGEIAQHLRDAGLEVRDLGDEL